MSSFFHSTPCTPRSTIFPYTTLFRSAGGRANLVLFLGEPVIEPLGAEVLVEVLRLDLNGRSLALGKYLGPERFRSEEHTSELQSRGHLVCRLLLVTKNPEYEHKEYLY